VWFAIRDQSVIDCFIVPYVGHFKSSAHCKFSL
jgi:hypothetical protein